MQQTSKQTDAFDGFTGVTCPEDWPLVAAYINNLAEFKVVEWLFRNTWEIWTEITTEQFMHGYCDEEGFKIDCGTGLSKPSVIQGLRRAIEHGLIECQIDATDPTHIRKFYRIRLADVKKLNPTNEQDFYPVTEEVYAQTDDFYPDFEQEKSFLPPSNEFEIYPQNDYEDILRIQEEDVNVVEPDPPPAQESSSQETTGKYPAFLCARIEQFSQVLGDYEHTASNIGQARRIYALYLASGGTSNAFSELLQSCRELAQSAAIHKKNKQGMPNRMPYFFICLRRACLDSNKQAA